VSIHFAERVKHVQNFQRKKIEEHLHRLRVAEQHAHQGGPTIAAGVTVAVPKKKLHTILPSYKKDKGTVELDEIMGLIAKHAKGTEFYAKGHPVLNRLALLAREKKLRAKLGIGHQSGKRDEKVSAERRGQNPEIDVILDVTGVEELR
jgi:hypothetical protein